MYWRIKAFAQATFSAIPFGERLNYWCQRKLTRNYPMSDAKFVEMVALACQHVDAIRAHGGKPVDQASFYEFGAGWTMLSPLAFYCLGAERQTLVDIVPLVKPELVNDTIDKFQRLGSTFPLCRVPRENLSPRPHEAIHQLAEWYGIEYRAPVDARDTGLPPASVDYITSTNTLEHIPQRDIASVTRECQRIMDDRGLISFRIDYQDHYSYFDKNISAFNMLGYSESQWRKYNPHLHYQNRLRHCDYVRQFTAAGLDVIDEKACAGTLADREIVQRMRLNQCYQKYSVEDLTVRYAHVVMGKAASAMSRVA